MGGRGDFDAPSPRWPRSAAADPARRTRGQPDRRCDCGTTDRGSSARRDGTCLRACLPGLVAAGPACAACRSFPECARVLRRTVATQGADDSSDRSCSADSRARPARRRRNRQRHENACFRGQRTAQREWGLKSIHSDGGSPLFRRRFQPRKDHSQTAKVEAGRLWNKSAGAGCDDCRPGETLGVSPGRPSGKRSWMTFPTSS